MKKRLIALGIFLFLASIPALIYWKSLAASVVTSALNRQYGVSLNYDRLDVSLLPGGVSLIHPFLNDSERGGGIPLASAERVYLSILSHKAIRGILDMRRISANRMTIEFVDNRKNDSSQLELNWVQTIDRIKSNLAKESRPIALSEKGNAAPAKKSNAKPSPNQSPAKPVGEPSPAMDANAARSVKEATPVVKEATHPVKEAVNSEKTAAPELKASKEVKESTAPGKDTTRSAKDAIPSASPAKAVAPLKIPVIDIDDLLLNYSVQSATESFAIRMDRFSFIPTEYEMTFQNAQAFVIGKSDPVLKLKNLTIDNALAPPGSKLDIAVESIRLNGRQTAPNQYDFNYITQIWVHVYREIGQAISDPQPSGDSGFPIATLKASDVTTKIVPQNAAENGSGVLLITVNDLSYILKKDELILLGVVLTEAGKPLLRLDRLVLNGLAGGKVEVQRLALSGARLDIQEDQNNLLNVSRAIETIRSVVDSFASKEAKTAQARPSFLKTLQTASIDDSAVIWKSESVADRQISLGQLRYAADSHNLSATDFLLTRRNGDKNTIVSISSIIASPTPDLSGNRWEQLILDQPNIECNWLSDRYELVDSASDWLSLPGAIRRGLKIDGDATNPNPFFIQDLQIRQADVQMMDYTIEPPIRHHFTNVNMQWMDLELGNPNAPMTPMILEAALSEPSAGSLAFEGQASPAGWPLNVTGAAALALGDITAINPYLAASDMALPVRIVKGGFRTNAQASITDNHVRGIVDLYLYNPEFKLNDDSKWPLKIDQRTFINTLNNMKDKNGTIAFPNNVWSGDVRDPKFKRGLGLNDMLWSNVRGTLTTVFKLPFDFVGTVGNVVKKILGQDNPK